MKKKLGTAHHERLIALSRIEGQVRGIRKMVEARRYCVEILNALAAARGALKRVEAKILSAHLDACVRDAFENGNEKDKNEKMQEIAGLFQALRK